MGAVLAFAPDYDTPGIYDATREFLPSALRFVRFHGGTAANLYTFPSTGPMPRRREPIAKVLAAVTAPIEKLAFFCHGWRSGLQCGYGVDNVQNLASFVVTRCTVDAYVLLYACNTGADGEGPDSGPAGDGGFADQLRDTCEAQGRRVTVFGHTCRGVASSNPYARAFRPGMGGKGGEWYVDPKAPHWPKWVRALHEPMSTLCWRFPFMTSEQIRAELTAPPLVA
jgi:hypothetical protein